MKNGVMSLPDYKKTAIILACCGPGDTLLYILLPMFHDFFGVSLAEAGLLLAANRLSRIFGYQYVVFLYNKYGDRLICQISSIGTLICCLSYIFGKGFLFLLIIRVIWGLSFAGMNLSTQSTATSNVKDRSKIAGKSRSLISSGQMVSLPLCSLIVYGWGIAPAYIVMSLMATFAYMISFTLPYKKESGSVSSQRKLKPPTSIALWSLTEGIVIDGFFIFSLATMFTYHNNPYAIIIACVIMASRYAFEFFFSPIGGKLAFNHGAKKILIIFSFFTCVALVLYAINWIYVAPFLILILRALQLPLVPVVVAENTEEIDRISELASNALWRDIGAGIGPLIAGFTTQNLSFMMIIFSATLLLFLATINLRLNKS